MCIIAQLSKNTLCINMLTDECNLIFMSKCQENKKKIHKNSVQNKLCLILL